MDYVVKREDGMYWAPDLGVNIDVWTYNIDDAFVVLNNKTIMEYNMNDVLLFHCPDTKCEVKGVKKQYIEVE